ncbi:putative reverse transcriptase domain-containing protein [Tanacetum coccineum]
MNEDFYHEQNSCYDPNSFGFDQFQPLQYTVNHPIFNVQNNLLNSQNKLMEQMTSICDMVGQIMQKKEEERQIAEDQAAKDRYWKIPICYDDDEDYTIAITHVLSTEEPVDSLIMEDEHLDTIPVTESDEVIKSSVKNLVPIPSESEGIPNSVCDVPLCNNLTPLEAFKEHSETIIDSNNDYSSSDVDSYENINYVDASPPDAEIVSLEVVEIVIPEVGGVDTDILLAIKDDILREKLLNVNLLIANIEALKDNPTPSSDFVTKSLNLFLEETKTFDNSLPLSKTFCFNLEEISSGSTTTRSDYSLLDYEAFYFDDDHIKEKSSGSTTTHADFSKYDSFIFDLSINLFPPADRSDFNHEEFAGELAHIISPPEYDCFCFKIEAELGDIFLTRKPRVHVPNGLPTHPTLNLDFILSSESLFAYVDCPDCDDSRARGFVLRSLGVSHPQLHFGGIPYPNLIDKQSSPDVRPIGLREPKYSPFGPGKLDRVWTGVCAPAVDPTLGIEEFQSMEEDKAFGKIIHRHGGSLILYRGRNYNPKKRLVIPLMLWKPQEPIYPKLIKTTIEGLSIEETKELRKKGLEKKDYKKLGAKLRDLVPCILVTFEKEQIVIWRGKDYKPKEGGCFLMARESFDNSSSDADANHEGQDVSHDQIESDSCDKK